MRSLRTKTHRAPAVATWARACILAALVAFPGMSSAQTDRETMLKAQRDMRSRQYTQMQTMVTSMPALEAKSIDEVFRLKMDGNNLALTSPLLDADHAMGAVHVQCNSFKGPTYASVSLMGGVMPFGVRGGKQIAPARPGGATIFYFATYELPNPDELVTLSLQAFGSRLEISRQTRRGAGGFHMVHLLQQRSSPGPGPVQSMIQLNITDFGDDPQGGVPRNIGIQSTDFQAMLRDHPREADEYIRPLFAEIGQESALAPDGRVAWQVLSDHWQPDPELARKVEKILPELNDVDFHARDKALAELDAMGMPGAAVLLHMDRMGLSPEQNLMIDRTLAPFSQLSGKEAARLRGDTEFLADCLYLADHEVRAAALDRLRQVTGKDLPFDLDAPEAARHAAISVLRKQLASKPADAPATEPAKS